MTTVPQGAPSSVTAPRSLHWPREAMLSLTTEFSGGPYKRESFVVRLTSDNQLNRRGLRLAGMRRKSKQSHSGLGAELWGQEILMVFMRKGQGETNSFYSVALSRVHLSF
jgi:hypothetical protein